MTDLGLTLAWAAVQVTLLALVGAALYAVAARRRPGAGAPIAVVCLTASTVLTLLALCPLPMWWNWPLSSTSPSAAIKVAGNSPSSEAADAATFPSDQATEGVTLSMNLLRRGWDRFRNGIVLPTIGRGNAWALVGVLLLAGAAFGLLRLLLGLWAIHACRRRSLAIDDPLLRQLLDDLCRAMACPSVEVRETPELTTAATAGWRRPLVLLPFGWRQWSEPELRAALAHELAHVCRRDYLLGLLARLSVALHFYHPLLRWLAGRLRLQQELAADALGARFAGGPTIYLRALAQLALRQDSHSHEWPIPALFSSRGMLMRRIHMLRARSDSGSSPSRWGRSALVALLVTAALGVSALRCPAQKDEPAKTETKAAVDAVPFDVSFVPPDTMGIVGFRPARAAARPGMNEMVKKCNDGMEEMLKMFKAKSALNLPVEKIEQAILTFFVHTDPSKKDGQSSLVMGLNMVRTVEDFDWHKKMHELAPDAVKVERYGKEYYRFVEDADHAPMQAMFGQKAGYYIPDRRTLVIDSEKNLKRLLDRKPGEKPAFTWSEGWKRIENELLAVVLDNSRGRFTRELEARSNPDPEARPFCEHALWMTFAVNGEDDFVLQSLTKCRDEKGAESLRECIEGLLASARGALTLAASPKKMKKLSEEQKFVLPFASELLRHSSLRREGTKVELRFEAKTNFTRLLLAWFGGEIGL
jgi:beta-lactamase regulating signal transducer with metallopeptidase domain